MLIHGELVERAPLDHAAGRVGRGGGGGAQPELVHRAGLADATHRPIPTAAAGALVGHGHVQRLARGVDRARAADDGAGAGRGLAVHVQGQQGGELAAVAQAGAVEALAAGEQLRRGAGAGALDDGVIHGGEPVLERGLLDDLGVLGAQLLVGLSHQPEVQRPAATDVLRVVAQVREGDAGGVQHGEDRAAHATGVDVGAGEPDLADERGRLAVGDVPDRNQGGVAVAGEAAAVAVGALASAVGAT